MLKRKERFERCMELFPDRAEFYADQVKELEAELLRINACQRCGRPLQGEESQKRGYGPECARKVGGTIEE